jgi:hypothetical protein
MNIKQRERVVLHTDWVQSRKSLVFCLNPPRCKDLQLPEKKEFIPYRIAVLKTDNAFKVAHVSFACLKNTKHTDN